jgi:hypothetical protein
VEAVARDLFLLENILVRQEFYQQRGKKKNIYIWGHMCIERGVVEGKRKSLLFVLNGFVDCALFPDLVLRPHVAG